MNRTGSQKTLLVVSIIEIVLGALSLVGGLMAALAGGVIGGAAGVSTEELAEAGLSASDVGVASAAVSILAVFLIIASLITIVEGILGVRAANDASKIMPVWILAIISLAGAVISLIMTFVNGTFATSGVSGIVTLVINGLMFWVANNIKVEAGK